MSKRPTQFIGLALTAVALLAAAGAVAPIQRAHAQAEGACQRTEDCADPLLICVEGRCLSRENEPLSQIRVLDPEGNVVRPGTDLADFVRYAYLFGLSFVGIAATLSIFYGGLQYFLSASSAGKADAKDRIINGALGIALALGAYLILRTINPNLVSFAPIESFFEFNVPDTQLQTRGASCRGVGGQGNCEVGYRCASIGGQEPTCITAGGAPGTVRPEQPCEGEGQGNCVAGYRCEHIGLSAPRCTPQPPPGKRIDEPCSGSGQGDCATPDLYCASIGASQAICHRYTTGLPGTVGPGDPCQGSTNQGNCREGLLCRSIGGRAKTCIESSR